MDGEKPVMVLNIGKCKTVGGLNGEIMENSKCSEEMTLVVLKVHVKLVCLIQLI
jgi:hypothetical protein